MERDFNSPLLFPSEGIDTQALWDIINPDGSENFFNEISQRMTAQVQSIRSSLPATSDWPGDYGFDVTFGQTDVTNTKNLQWIYCENERKLYVNRDVSCPVNFSVSYPMLPTGTLVRAMAVYTSPQHANESVHRCLTHSLEEMDQKVFEAQHLVRSECQGAKYFEHPETKRHSVTVPFENPPAGQCFSTYLYKFACLGSCSGGPNRRPLTLVFTLEHNNVVLGRCSIHLRICANPGRDSGAVTKRTKAPPAAKKSKKELPQKEAVPKRKIEDEECYFVKTRDPECARFLQNMKTWFKMNRKLGNLPLEARYWIGKLVTSSEDDFSSREQ